MHNMPLAIVAVSLCGSSYRLLIIICAHATPLWQTSATKCDIHVTVWLEGVAAAGDVRRWATWWALDGPDDTHCLRAVDTKANLNEDVLDVLSTMDVWHLGNHIPSVCALTGDGKAMLSANYHKGKWWLGYQCIYSLARANFVRAQCRWGSFLRAIGPCNRVLDVKHGSCRIANAIVKRVNETLKDLITLGMCSRRIVCALGVCTFFTVFRRNTETIRSSGI